MSEPRVLFDPNRIAVPASDGAPRAIGKEGVQARHQLGEYLDAVLQRPLYFDDGQSQARVETALDTMTQAERVYLEIEMQGRARVLHSFEYDPLR
jgi:hypothetical protein